MFETATACPPRMSLAEVIESRIDSRTTRGIRRLRVESRPGGVVVHGYAPSYYLKQLALAAVREVVETAPVDLAIEVIA